MACKLQEIHFEMACELFENTPSPQADSGRNLEGHLHEFTCFGMVLKQFTWFWLVLPCFKGHFKGNGM